MSKHLKDPKNTLDPRGLNNLTNVRLGRGIDELIEIMVVYCI